MEPYFSIDEKEWEYIKDNFTKDDIKESLVEVLMEYEKQNSQIIESLQVCLDPEKDKVLERDAQEEFSNFQIQRHSQTPQYGL